MEGCQWSGRRSSSNAKVIRHSHGSRKIAKNKNGERNEYFGFSVFFSYVSWSKSIQKGVKFGDILRKRDGENRRGNIGFWPREACKISNPSIFTTISYINQKSMA